MATVGLYQIQLALVDGSQKLISGTGAGLGTDGIYTVDHKDLGAKTANITGLAGTIAKIYGSKIFGVEGYFNAGSFRPF